uniref:Peptidase S1 domain-containing protein n=1 Tax=Poecilia reticulata TaxID=8081 RepID=A0A3P9NZS4_POERE
LLNIVLTFITFVSSRFSPVCGKAAGSKSRIIGGQDAQLGDWPWQVYYTVGVSYCGGSLISNEWVDDLNYTEVQVGVVQLDGISNSTKVTRKLSEIICHPEYDSSTNENDICLLKLSAPVDFTPYIQPICLASENSTFHDGLVSWVTGFGVTGKLHNSHRLRQHPLKVEVPIVVNNRCMCYYSETFMNLLLFNANLNPNNYLCAGFKEGGKDSCQGDSGGPLMVQLQNSPQWVQAGVVSFGDGCAVPMKPGIYTRVSQYQSWINDTPGNGGAFDISLTFGKIWFTNFSITPVILGLLTQLKNWCVVYNVHFKLKLRVTA